MIALLTGRLKRKASDYLIVDVAGVGYQVQVPLSTYSRLPELGEDVSLHIHTYVREDSLSLFGFLEEAEKDLFLLLMGVSGIGPRIALSVLSSMSVSEICSAICTSDDSKLCTIPGIGRKTAARLVLELKDKASRLQSSSVGEGEAVPPESAVEDAVSALVNLGYKKPLAQDVLKKIRQNKPDAPIEELIREALGVIMKR